MIFHRNTKKGFSLIEVVVYVSLFSTLSGVAMASLFASVRAFNELRISRDINDSSVTIMERLTRDIKSATTIDLINSTFGATPGRLTLNTRNASGTTLVVEYYVATSTLRIKENGIDVGSLMSAKTKVDGLIFRQINLGNTVAVKTELHLKSSRGSVSDADHFYNTSILRGSY